jgi:recombination associated protein RdgC
MKKLKFPAFIPYLASQAVFDWLKADSNVQVEDELTDVWGSKDPSPTSWRSQGLIAPVGDDLIYQIEAGKFLMAMQVNERILPGKVRDEFLAKEVAHVEELNGRKPSKKDYAMLKEEVEFSLLPKAFIRRSVTPVIFIAKHRLVLVCTTSPKRAEDTIVMLCGLFNQMTSSDTSWYPLQPNNAVVGTLTLLANEGFSDENEDTFMVTDNAVLRGEGKQTIRIKDKDIESADVTKLLKQQYDVHELGFSYDPNGNEENRMLSFKLSDKLVFKGLKFNDGAAKVEMGDAETTEQQLEAVLWLTARTYADVLINLMHEFGGFKTLAELKREAKEIAKTKPVDPLNDDDEEL